MHALREEIDASPPIGAGGRTWTADRHESTQQAFLAGDTRCQQ